MLQVDVMPYASDALEDAMCLAQTKSLNSFTFSDCINYLNYAWSDIYSRMAMIDAGYYSKTIKLTKKLTHLPPYVKNTVLVYAAQRPVGYDRVVYQSTSMSDLTSSQTYNISGNDLYCADAERTTVWLNFVPACPQLFFTYGNRDPIIHEEELLPMRNGDFNLCEIIGIYTDEETHEEKELHLANDKHAVIDEETQEEIEPEINQKPLIMNCHTWYKRHKGTNELEDITEYIVKEIDYDENAKWNLVYISCDYPYIFLTYENSISHKFISGFLDESYCFNRYNPFDFIGRGSNVEYIKTTYNDKTGLGSIVIDHNDIKEDGTCIIKELGWTPDSKLNYPVPEMYRYLVARLADKFSALNESNVMGVQKELNEARYAFEAFFEKDKSSFKRIINVNPPTIGDYL